MIYKAYSSTVEDLDQKGRVLVAANAIGNTDADGDISAEGSFAKTLKNDWDRLRWFLNHDKNILLGVPLNGQEKERKLQMLGQMNLEKQVSRDVYADYKLMAEHGRSLEHSIGVIAKKRNAKNSSIVEEWQLMEYSTLTHWGANSETPMLGIKNYKPEDLESIEERINWMELQLKKGDYTDDKFRKIEMKLKDLLKIIGSAKGEDAVTEPKTPEHQVENVAFDPTKLKAAADAFALREFIKNLNN